MLSDVILRSIKSFKLNWAVVKADSSDTNFRTAFHLSENAVFVETEGTAAEAANTKLMQAMMTAYRLISRKDYYVSNPSFLVKQQIKIATRTLSKQFPLEPDLNIAMGNLCFSMKNWWFASVGNVAAYKLRADEFVRLLPAETNPPNLVPYVSDPLLDKKIRKVSGISRNGDIYLVLSNGIAITLNTVKIGEVIKAARSKSRDPEIWAKEIVAEARKRRKLTAFQVMVGERQTE